MNPTWLYVGVIYSIALWLARRAGAVVPARVALFFYALALIFMWKPLTGPWTTSPADYVQRLPPWYHISGVKRPINGQINDIVLQIIPWAHQAREAVRSFSLPLWNSMAGCGYPLMANGQSAPFSIIRLLALPLPLDWAVTAEAAFKVLVALTFMYLLARHRKYDELPSVIGAVSYGFCTFLHVWLHFPLGTAAAFIPAALYAIDLLAERVTYRRFLFTAALWAVMFYNGHPETVAHATFLSGLYLSWIVFVERSEGRTPGLSFESWRPALRTLFAAGGALACGAMLAMPFIAPFLEALPRSKRYQELGVQPHVIGIFSDWTSKVLMLEPTFFGHVPFERPWVDAASAEGLEGAAGILGLCSLIAIVIRAVARRRFRDREVFFALAMIFFIGVVLAWPGISTIFAFFFKLAANARLRSMICFLGALQTAAALDFILRERAWPTLSGLLGGAVTLFLLIKTVQFPSEFAKSTAIMGILPSMAVLALAALVPLAGRHKHWLMMLVLTAVTTEVFIFNWGWNPNLPIEYLYPKTPLLERMETLKKQSHEPFRIVGIGAMFFPNMNAIFGLEDVRVHDPMANGRYLGLLRVRGDYDPTTYFAQWRNLDSRMLDYLNVRYVLADTHGTVADEQRFELIYTGKDGRIFVNHDAMSRFIAVRNVVLEFNREKFNRLVMQQKEFRDTCLANRLPVSGDQERNDLLAPRAPNAPAANVAIQDATPVEYRLHVSAPRYTMIASSIASWPGWHVSSNGRQLRPLEVNGAFLGFVVPPGENDVRVWYAPWSFRIGVLVMLAAVTGLITYGVRTSRPSSSGAPT